MPVALEPIGYQTIADPGRTVSTPQDIKHRFN
jgi:hypothetical protein